MATTVVDVITVDLDGKTIECKPLKIKYLRRFMERIAALSEVVDDNIGSIDILMDVCGIALEQYTKKTWETEELEEVLDLPLMYRIVEGASGIVLDDASPNPQ